MNLKGWLDEPGKGSAAQVLEGIVSVTAEEVGDSEITELVGPWGHRDAVSEGKALVDGHETTTQCELSFLTKKQ